MFQMLSNIARCFISSSALSISNSPPPRSFNGYRRSFGNSKTMTLGMIVTRMMSPPLLLHPLLHTSFPAVSASPLSMSMFRESATPLPTQPNRADQPTCSLGYLPALVSPNYRIYTSLIDALVNENTTGHGTAHKKAASEAEAAQDAASQLLWASVFMCMWHFVLLRIID